MSAAPVELGHVGLPAVNASAAAAKPVKTANSIAHSAKASSERKAPQKPPQQRQERKVQPAKPHQRSGPAAAPKPKGQSQKPKPVQQQAAPTKRATDEKKRGPGRNSDRPTREPEFDVAAYAGRLSGLVYQIARRLKLRYSDIDVANYNPGGVSVKTQKSGAQTVIVSSLFAKFVCTNDRCGKPWTSAKAGLSLKQLAVGKLPYVCKLWRQACLSCKAEAYPMFKEDWLVERLERVIRIMAGRPVPQATFSADSAEEDKPHEAEHCELCQKGEFCRFANDRARYNDE